jgi:hypothetical protein
VGFTDTSLTSRLIIGDGTRLLGCDGTTVAWITPAANLPSPQPANELTAINDLGCRFVWSYKRQIFISPGTNKVFYSLPYKFDYFPEVNVEVISNNNDIVNGCGVAFDNVMLVPMRRGWNVWTGSDINDFQSKEFLNTTDGVIAPRSIVKLTYLQQ